MTTKEKFLVYCATFPNGKRYIGVTSNFKKRKRTHIYQAMTDTGFRFHRAMKKYGPSNVVWKILASTSSRDEVNELEIHYIQKFNTFKEGGYNSNLGGATGGKWTLTLVKEELKKLKVRTRVEWDKKSPNSYEWAFSKDLARSIAAELGIAYKAKYWSYDEVLKEVIKLKINGRAEWFKKSQNSYAYAAKHGFITDVAKKLKWDERNSWSVELVWEDVIGQGFTSLKEWREKSRFSYIYASRNGFVEDISTTLGWTRYRRESWSIDDLIADAKANKCKSRQDWRTRSSRAYSYAKKYKQVDEVARSLGWGELVKWDEKKCLELIKAHKVKTSTEWIKVSSGSYDFAKRNKLVKKILSLAGVLPPKQYLHVFSYTTGKKIGIYESVKKCARDLKLPSASKIYDVLKGTYPHYQDLTFKWKTEVANV